MAATLCAGGLFISPASVRSQSPAPPPNGKEAAFSFKNPAAYAPKKRRTPEMIGDMGGFNFGGFNFGGGSTSGGGGGGGASNSSGGGGFQLGGGQFGGGGSQGGFQLGGGQFGGGGFQGGGGQFGGGQFGGGGFQGGFQLGGGQFGGGGFQGGFQGGGGQFGGGGFQGGFQGGLALSPFRGAYKAGEGESPAPEDRIHLSYNFYSNVESIANIHRETMGIEKTLFHGAASIGLRIPYLQTEGGGFPSADRWGDLSTILKYAPVNDPDTGNVFSLGIVVTAPTGSLPHSFSVDGNRVKLVHSTLLQPFVGYIWNSGNFYVQGFSSVMVPTDSDDVTVLFNDVGVGYHIPCHGGLFTEIVPTFEVHVNTPLNHRGSEDLPRFRDAVDLTTGAHFYFNERISLTLGVGTTVTNPRLFDIEGIATVSFRF